MNPLLILTNNNHHNKNQYTTVYIESDTIEVSYPNKIQLLGNINVKYDNSVIISDTLTILNHDKNHILHTVLHADGNLHYHNENIILTGSYAQLNLNNKNIDLYQCTYCLYKFNIYGSSTVIMQRKNNYYTIMKKSTFTNCKFCNNCWNITGSNITYDWNKNNVHIWNAYFKIKTIPIFYLPYLLFNPNQNKILESYIPTIKFNSKYGLILKTPFPLIFSKYYSGNIIPYYTSSFGTGIQTKIYYSTYLGTGQVTTNIADKNNCNYFYNNKIFYQLHWKHHGIINNKWYLDVDWINQQNSINYNFNKTNKKYSNNINNHINQKFLFYYNNNHWKTGIIYLGHTYDGYKKNIIQNHCIYSVAPQLEIRFHSNPIWKKRLYFQTFNQLSRFVPSNDIYPTATRLHIEPIINCTINNYWLKFNIDTRLKMTHYQQRNLNFYNIKQYKQCCLKNKINRIIPQFKIDGIIHQKIPNIIKSNKYFLESKLQYLYVPYVFQENIGIYDTKIIYINQNNLFDNIKSSGLDRIQSTNQFLGNITIRCFNKKSELFFLSINQILNLKQNTNSTNNVKDTKHIFHKPTIHSNMKLFSLGTGYWNINNYWNIHAEMQYDTLQNQLDSGNAILEYIGKNNQIFQSNYRYINAHCFKKILTPSNNLTYYKTISQIGIITFYPLTKNWILGCSYYHNVQSHYMIDQTIGIQYSTPCYIVSIIFERNITDRSNKSHINSYENKIRFNFNLIKLKSNFQLDLYKLLQSNMIPYQNLYHIH